MCATPIHRVNSLKMPTRQLTSKPIAFAPRLMRSIRKGLRFSPELDSDYPFLLALYATTRAAELEQVPWSPAEKSAFVEMQFQAQRQHYQSHYPDAEWLVVSCKDTQVGRLYLEGWPSEIRIIDIALMPDWRGQGLGTQMMRDVMSIAAAGNIGVGIHVESASPAIRLYSALGFEKIEDKGVYHLMRWNSPVHANTAS